MDPLHYDIKEVIPTFYATKMAEDFFNPIAFFAAA